MTIRLEHDGRVYGMLSVSIPTSFIADEEEQVLFGEIGFALHGMELESEGVRRVRGRRRVMKRCVYPKLNRSHFCSVLVLEQKHRSR
ncbi:MAG: hypothetical protein ACXQTY_07945 [Candidatus Methanogasteraceae archaeon]